MAVEIAAFATSTDVFCQFSGPLPPRLIPRSRVPVYLGLHFFSISLKLQRRLDRRGNKSPARGAGPSQRKGASVG